MACRTVMLMGVWALLCFTLDSWSATLPGRSQTNSPPQQRIGRTNAAPPKAPAVPPVFGKKPVATQATSAAAPPMKGPSGVAKSTNAPASKSAITVPQPPKPGGGFTDNLKERWTRLRSNPMAASIGAVIVCAILALILGLRAMYRRRKPQAVPKGKAKGKSAANISGCNVLQAWDGSQKLWVFDARSFGFSLNREYTAGPGEKLPQHVVSRTWRALFQKKLNVALLPPEHVFLKVIQLPRSTYEEMLAMVELQVEKLSPMPLAQVVWGIQVLPRTEGELDTVIVMIVSRGVVEEFLGKLEERGYLADRLELPLLDELQATTVQADGAYIYPVSSSGRNMALVAWWYGGILHNLDIATLPDTDRAANLREQLLQMSWAGELEGWVTGPPQWTLVASPELLDLWQPPLREGLEQDIQLLEPLKPSNLAGKTAERAAGSPLAASLMPAEFVERYRQQFVDRLWMRGLGAVVGLYVLGVLVYFVALGVATYKTRQVEQEVAGLGQSYTNALQLKAQSRVLQDRMELKYAALDCWAAVARQLPEQEGLVLDSFNFSEGRRLTLSGSAKSDQTTHLLDFEAALRKTTLGNQPMFGKVDNVSWNVNPGTASLTWQLTAELKRMELK